MNKNGCFRLADRPLRVTAVMLPLSALVILAVGTAWAWQARFQPEVGWFLLTAAWAVGGFLLYTCFTVRTELYAWGKLTPDGIEVRCPLAKRYLFAYRNCGSIRLYPAVPKSRLLDGQEMRYWVILIEKGCESRVTAQVRPHNRPGVVKLPFDPDIRKALHAALPEAQRALLEAAERRTAFGKAI